MGDESFKKPLVAAFNDLLAPARAKLRVERTHEHAVNEKSRVKELVRKMGEYEASELRLAQAQMAFENGNTACLDETIIRPTPELLACGQFEPFAADTVKGTARSAITMRRTHMMFVTRYHEDGIIDENQLNACYWYRNRHEETGLTGNIASVDYGKQVFATPKSYSMFNDWQIDMQELWRDVRSQMTAKWLPFFDAIVLYDVSPRVAIRLARKRNGTEVGLFRDVVSELTAAYDTLKKVV